MRVSIAVIRSRRLRSSAISSSGDGLGGVGGRPVGQPGRCLPQVIEQLGRGAGVRAGVAGGVQPGGQALLRQPAGVARGREAGQERQGDLAVELVEQPDHARVGQLQVRAELVVRGDPGLDQVGAGADQHPQAHGGVGVGGQRGEPAAVGAQDVGEQVGVEAVVLVPGGAVAGAQGGDLSAGDDEHGQAGVEQGRHDRAVAAFDRDPADLVAVQHGDQLGQPGRGVRDGKPLDRGAGVVDDADGVFGPRPVHSGPPDRLAVRCCRGAAVAASGSFIDVVAPVLAGERPRSGAAAGRSLKRSRRTTPSPVSTPRPVGPRVVKAGLEGHASLGDDPTVRDAHRTRRARQIQLALSDASLYGRRNVVERCFNRLKQCHDLATVRQRAAYYRAELVIAAIVLAPTGSAGHAQAAPARRRRAPRGPWRARGRPRPRTGRGRARAGAGRGGGGP